MRAQLELDCREIVPVQVPKWVPEERKYEGYVGQMLVPAEWYGKWEFRTDIATPAAEQPKQEWTEADEQNLQTCENMLKQYEAMGMEPDPRVKKNWKELTARKAKFQK